MVLLRALGGAFSRVAPDATAIAYREAEALLIVNAIVARDAAAEQIAALKAGSDSALAFTRGAYGGFSAERGDDVTRSMYPPATLERLRRVKGEFDPDNVFRQNHNILPPTGGHATRLTPMDRTTEARRIRLLTDPMAHTPDEVLARVASDLADRFDGVFAPETVGRYVRESNDLLVALAEGATDDDGIDERVRSATAQTAQWAADRLVAIASARSTTRAAGAPFEVLFVCVQNSGRSQLAAAILKHRAGARVHVRSAGSRPARAVRSTVVAALDEIGWRSATSSPSP